MHVMTPKERCDAVVNKRKKKKSKAVLGLKKTLLAWLLAEHHEQHGTVGLHYTARYVKALPSRSPSTSISKHLEVRWLPVDKQAYQCGQMIYRV